MLLAALPGEMRYYFFRAGGEECVFHTGAQGYYTFWPHKPRGGGNDGITRVINRRN